MSRPYRSKFLYWLPGFVAAAGVAAALAFSNAPRDSQVSVRELPQEARQTLQLIRRGGPYPYSRDGMTFGNYERRLPEARRGHYSEYTVDTPGIRNRGARRIVIGCERQSPASSPPPGIPGLAHCRGGGVAYYTADHYETFRRIVE